MHFQFRNAPLQFLGYDQLFLAGDIDARIQGPVSDVKETREFVALVLGAEGRKALSDAGFAGP